MKKIISLILVVCMALSLAAVLTGCGGGAKNAWQEYLGAKGWSVPAYQNEVENNNGTVAANKDGYSLTGRLEVKGRGNGESFVATMKDKMSHAKATDGVTDEKYDDIRYINYIATYGAKSNTLYVEVSAYHYYTILLGEQNGFIEGEDGFAFAGTGTCLTLKFDMKGYFANGELTAEDITENSDFDMSLLTRNYTGISTQGPVYTERNTEWKAQAMDNIIDSINETLGIIDRYIENNPV